MKFYFRWNLYLSDFILTIYYKWAVVSLPELQNEYFVLAL